jgi:PAS domain S-box-containing protein
MIVIRPLHKFSQGADAIGKGDFNYHLDISSSDEIGILAESFNTMTKELKEKNEMLETASKELREYSESLEEIVKLRTQELEKKTIELENEVAIRKKTEKNVRTEKAYIDQLFESAQEAIVMADKEGRVLRVNSEFIRLFGYTIDELLGSSLDDLIAPKDHYDKAVATTKKVTEGEKVAFETVRQRKNGTLLDASVLASPIIVDGKQVAIYGIYRDITALKQAEKALEERSKELAEANIRLKELDRLKSMFIASMSHELRTPLNSIIGFTGIILQGLVGEINEEQRKQLALVKNSANHLLALINDVIDVSKIEADQIELFIKEYDLADLIQEVNDSFKVAVDEKGLKLSLEMPKRFVIKSDERRTKQVFMNLVSNAVKFTDRGEIVIKAAKKDKRVEISVRDTGIGIEKKAMDKLFKAFSRIYTKDTLKEGTGLGLYLSRRMANLLGGELSAKSEFGKGSKFTFTLPLKFKEEQRNEKDTGS